MRWTCFTVLVAAAFASCTADNPNNGQDASIPDAGDAPKEDVAVPDTGADAAVSPDIGPDLPPPAPGKVVVDPTQITFGEVRHGESETVKVAVTNTGGQSIIVSNVVLQELNRTGEPELVPGASWDTSFEVGPNLFREIEVTYQPNDFGADRGELEIQTTDPDASLVTIRIEAPNAYADLDAPQFLRFGGVPVGESSTKRITLYNRGIDPLTIEDLVIGGISGTFTLSGTQETTTVLETNEDLVIDLTYTPVAPGTDRGTLTVLSDDPDQPEVEIALTGNDPTPCLDVSPNPVDFGEATAGAPQAQEVVMLNCSRTLSVDITGVMLTDDGGGVFSLSGLPQLPLTIAPLQTAKFTATGTLADVGISQGSIGVESTDAKADPTIDLLIHVPPAP